jgi:hypothetical protein
MGDEGTHEHAGVTGHARESPEFKILRSLDMKKIIFIFLCLGITFNLYSQAVSSLEIEYMELLEDIWDYGSDPTIPYYTDSKNYRNSQDRYFIDIDNDFVFAIHGTGFLRFVDPSGKVIYSRYLWLGKGPDGYFYGGPIAGGRCTSEFFKKDREGHYKVTAYLPLPGSNVKRGEPSRRLEIEMDEVIPVEREVVSRKQNTTMVDLVYTVNRMLEIAYTLKQMQTDFSYNYEFKIRTLERILNLVIEDRYKADKEYDNRIKNEQPLTYSDFYDLYPNRVLIREMLPFLELKR